MVGDAGLIEFLVRSCEGLGRAFTQTPSALPAWLMAAFVVGWVASYAWDVFRTHILAVAAVAVGALVLASVVTVVPTALVAASSCESGITRTCADRERAHETCSQRHDDWQKWQRCVERRTDG